MKKTLLILLSIFLLCGCSSKAETITLSHTVTLKFFYIETCSECKAFKKNVIPELEEAFGDSIIIEQYDLDDEDTLDVYDEVIDSLIDFDESYYGLGPAYALEGYFFKLGYTSGDEDYLIEDIQNALNDEELSDELSGLRFTYQ
ncbi:MAG: hypothetical protein LUG46_09010 [Erysipelotrichaceae bacterium]|nr:hypothetical protein [Erysipelotrichaceae bacterium]